MRNVVPVIRGVVERRRMQIDPKQRGRFPAIESPVALAARDGRTGWRVKLPRGKPLATPAVYDGRVYIGGGFGSYEFYCFDAADGRLVWQYQTEDDGPTGAIVIEDRVLFCTESCELEVLDTVGRRVWKKWLGDPILSMPAAVDGRVVVAYPDSRRDKQHYLACFALDDGRPIWRQSVPGDVITCPVISGDEVYAACLDGTISCLSLDGRPIWRQEKNATSAPTIWRNNCYYSMRRESQTEGSGAQQFEMLATRLSQRGPAPSGVASGYATSGSASASAVVEFPATSSRADWLDHAKRERASRVFQAQAIRDSHVGFGEHKGDSSVNQARCHLGMSHVSAIWSYQGSRPFFWRGRMYSGIGDSVQCVDPQTQEIYWSRRLADGKPAEMLDAELTPPAVVRGKVYVGDRRGRLTCLDAEGGAVLWRVALDEPIVFQPAVVAGGVFVATEAGTLFCVHTGDRRDDGWCMWGATPQHNGLEEE